MKKLLPALLAILPTALMAQNTGIGTITPTDQLHTTGTVRFENYRGPGTRVMQMDSSGRMVVSGAGTVFSSSTASPSNTIIDNGCSSSSPVASAITVSGQPTSISPAKIAVRININHAYDGDLVVFLEGPFGMTIRLVEGNGGSSANFSGTIFTDDAPGYLPAGSVNGFAGRYKPKGGLYPSCYIGTTSSTFGALGTSFGFTNINPNAVWTLRMFDASAGVTGTFISWQISFSGAESFTTADQANYIPKLVSGNLTSSVMYEQPVTGNIGLRTKSPLSVLHITGQDSNAITLENTSTLAAGESDFIDFKTGNYYTGRIASRGQSSNQASLSFYTYAAPAPGGLAERMTITDDGFVGIGSTTPAYNLDVAGNQRTTGNVLVNGRLGVGTITPLTEKLEVYGNIKMTDGNQANAAVLTSDAAGKGSWKLPPSYNSGFVASATAYGPTQPSGTTFIVPFSILGVGYIWSFNDGPNVTFANNICTINVAGVYHFDIAVEFVSPTGNGFSGGYVNTDLEYVNGAILQNNHLALASLYTGPGGTYTISYTGKFAVGDQLVVKLVQTSSSSGYTGWGPTHHWSGYRVY